MSDLQTYVPAADIRLRPPNLPPYAARHRSRLRRILAEPLLHFILLGSGLFILWAMIGDRFTNDTSHIVISSGQMERSIDSFGRTHLRAPDQQELKDLVDQEIHDEVYFREGIALGLDRNDEIIRRRIRQKIMFLTQDIADQEIPTDAQLQAYLDRHRQDYGGETDIAFSQIYLNPNQHHDLAGDAARLLTRLNNADGRIDYAAISDTLPVSNDFETTPAHVVANIFGHDFAAALVKQPAGSWVGPIQSGYGVHLVLVRDRQLPKAPVLTDIRDSVLRNWQAERREQVNETAFEDMRAKYKIKVELPPSSVASLKAP